MFSNLFHFRSKKLGNIAIKTKMCVLPLISYDDKTETLDYGQCFTIDVVSISPNSLTVRHNNNFKKGDMLEFRTKHALDDYHCLTCPNFKTMPETPAFSSFIGKIMWCSSKEAGVSIIMMRDRDKAAIKKLIEDKTK